MNLVAQIWWKIPKEFSLYYTFNFLLNLSSLNYKTHLLLVEIIEKPK